MRARLLTVFFAIALALAPAVADARPGLGGSMGSRGSHTWSSAPGTSTAPGGGLGMERSYTPNTGSYGSSYGGGYGRSYGGGVGMGRGGFFASGLMGGLIGAGIGGMLFGHGFFGGGMGSGFGFLGFILQMALIFFLGRYILRNLLGRPAMAGAGPGFFGRMMNQGQASPRAMPFGAGGGAPAGRQLVIAPADYQSFEQLLRNIQSAWTARDMSGLSKMATPEMVSYFGEQLAEQGSRGVHNLVTDVRLLQGDLSEAWAEGSREYATVAMRFTMIDVTKDASGRVVDGSPTERVTVTELWTFLRAQGGHWVLSAIQQAK